MKNILFYIIFLSLFSIKCSTHNSNSNPVSWYAKYSFPLTNKLFTLKELFIGNGEMLQSMDSDSINLGDTLNISFNDTVKTLFQSNLFKKESFSISRNLGDLKTSGLPLYPIPLKVPPINFPAIPLPSSIPISLKDSLKTKYFDYITFDKKSDSITIIIKNISDKTTFLDMQTSIISSGVEIFCLDTIKELLPQQSSKQKISLAGKTIFNFIGTSLNGTLAKNSIINNTTGLSIILDLNNQAISEAVILGTNIVYDFDFSIDMPMTLDSFDIEHLDISYISIPLTITNETPIQFSCKPIIGHAFDIAYCTTNGISSFTDMEQITMDSTYFTGNSIVPIKIIGAVDANHPQKNKMTLRISDTRFLPRWHNIFQWSWLPVTLQGSISHVNEKIKISKEMDLTLEMGSPKIFLSEIKGKYRKKKNYPGKLEPFKIPFDNTSGLLDHLRDKLTLVRNDFNLGINFMIIDNTHISQMDFECIIFKPNDSLTYYDTLSWTMNDIKKDSPETFNFTLSKIINSFPDSLVHVLNYSFPANASLTFGDMALSNTKLKTAIILPVETILDLTLYLIWEVTDTIRIALDPLHLPLSFNQNIVSALKDMTLSLDYSFFNQTNLNGRFFALAATTEYREELYLLNPSEICPEIIGSEKAKNLIPIFSPSGIILPIRNETNSNTIQILDSDMNSILFSDSLIIRSELMLPPTNADALTDTDHVVLQAQFHLEGIQSTNILQ